MESSNLLATLPSNDKHNNFLGPRFFRTVAADSRFCRLLGYCCRGSVFLALGPIKIVRTSWIQHANLHKESSPSLVVLWLSPEESLTLRAFWGSATLHLATWKPNYQKQFKGKMLLFKSCGAASARYTAYVDAIGRQWTRLRTLCQEWFTRICIKSGTAILWPCADQVAIVKKTSVQCPRKKTNQLSWKQAAGTLSSMQQAFSCAKCVHYLLVEKHEKAICCESVSASPVAPSVLLAHSYLVKSVPSLIPIGSIS